MAMFKGEDNSRISDKHMTWSLSRNGLYAGDVLVVRRATVEAMNTAPLCRAHGGFAYEGIVLGHLVGAPVNYR